MPTYTDPNCSDFDGPNRIKHVPFYAGTVFRRRGGKAVDLHHRYQAATALSSNLAGFAEVEDVGVTNGRPESIADGDVLPVNFALEKTCVFPTSGAVVATEANRGKDYDIYVDAQRASADGRHVACSIPPDLRYGSI
jgi:hypothetical protein